MIFEERSYQQNGIAAAISAMEAGKHALLQLPTGAGKAYMAASVALALCRKYNLKVVILVEQENLVRQLAQTVKDVIGINPGIVCSGINKKPDWSKQITVGTRQTAVNHLKKAGTIHLLIADEAHKWKLQKTGEPAEGQFAKIWSCLRAANPDIKLLGFTATPYTLSHGYIFGKNNKAGYEPYFEELTYRTTYKELFDCGKLCIPTLWIQDKDLLPDTSSISKVGLEYNNGEAGRVMLKYTEAVRHVIQERVPQDGFRFPLVFAQNIDCVQEYCRVCPGLVPIHSKLSEGEARRNMSMFQAGMTKGACSVDQLSIGFDFKKADVAILARLTESASIVVQQPGRVLRTADGKEKCGIYDLVGNIDKHLIDRDFDNPVVKVPRASKKTGDCPVKCCPGYDKASGGKCACTDLHAAVRICPECGHEFTKESIEELMPSLKKVEMYQLAEPVRMAVEDMECWDHQGKKNFTDENGEEYQKWMLLVKFSGGGFFDQLSVSLYLMFSDYYDGFAVDRSRDSWEQLSGDPFPDTVEEAVFLSANFKQPLEIEYQEKGGFKNVTEMFFEEQQIDTLKPEHTKNDVPLEWDNEKDGLVPF